MHIGGSQNVDIGSGLNVFHQDQDSNVIGLFLGETLDTVSIIANTVKDSQTVQIETTGHIPSTGEFICFQEDSKITQTEIQLATPIAGNQYTLTVRTPLDYPYTTAGGCRIQNVDMDVNGSVTPVVFEVTPRAPAAWDITRVVFSMVMASAGDDSRFGSLNPLSSGLYFRKEDAETSQNLFNIRENSDLRVEGYDLVYTSRTFPTGAYGMAARVTFNGLDKRGVVVRLDGLKQESIRGVVRDDITDLTKFRVKLHGHVVDR